jgi:WD40 repeat protein
MTHHDTVVAAVPRRIYANAHAYHINSISVNSDGETFISSDDLRINLWNLNIQDQSFNIVDIKPANMEELTEVITAAEFHPVSCNWFMYASSKGTIKLADMRQRALCDQHHKRTSQLGHVEIVDVYVCVLIQSVLYSLRARGRCGLQILLLRNHLLHLRCAVLPRWPLHCLP